MNENLLAAILTDDELHGMLMLPDEADGVDDKTAAILVNDARHATVRHYVMRSRDAEKHVENTLLAVWKDYILSDFRALHVVIDGERMLVHRKPDPRMGFTAFAKEHLLYANGYVRDTKRRVYVMGGTDPDGKRVRREIKATILVSWLTYASVPEYTRLWVKWKDGTRKLIHRKGL